MSFRTPIQRAHRARRSIAVSAALVLASSAFTLSVPSRADAGLPNACADVFAPLIAPTLVGGSYVIDSEKKLVFLSVNANAFVVGGSGPRWREQDFLQTADLDLGGCEFTSIAAAVGDPFNGTYDGGDHTISGLLIDEPTRSNVGFFAHADDATLRNIHLVAPNVTGGIRVGGLAGLLGRLGEGADEGLVENVFISDGRIEAKEYAVGGVVGEIRSGQVRDTHFSGAVLADDEGYSAAGGIAGSSNGAIMDSSASGSVTAAGDFVGGLVGDNFRGAIANSWATGDVEGADYVGGLSGGFGAFGFDPDARLLTASYATGKATGRNYVGGLVGKLLSNGTVADSFATGDVIGTAEFVGGLVGEALGTITNAYSTGDVSGAGSVGGLVGKLQSSGAVDGSFAKGDVTATARYVGGLVGEALGTITNAYATGDVSGDDSVGGLVGLSEGDVTNAFSVGRVTGGSKVGGLFGDEDDGDRIASFWDVETSGVLAGNSDATGLTTAEMTSFATFDTAWNTPSTTVIVEGWQAPSNPTWGICSRANNGYPFLLWQFDTDPCVDPVVVSAGEPTSTLAVACEGPMVVGGTITCTVTGGDAGIEILWRAAYNPPFASAGVTLDANGTGTFSFVVPAAALGQALTVELVQWTQPRTLGVVGGPVPVSVPAGEGSVPSGAVLLALFAAAGVVVAGRRLVTAG